MTCKSNLRFDDLIMDHIKYHQNDDAKLMLNQHLPHFSRSCLGSLLHHAVRVGNAEIARVLIALGSPVDYAGQDGITPLMVADCISTARVLLESGANINILNTREESSLHIALRSKDIEFKVVEALLLRAKMEAPTTEALVEKLLLTGCSFPYAVLLRDADILKELLQQGFDVNSKHHKNRTALHFAALVNDIKLVSLLINSGADINALDSNFASPLYYAAHRTNPTMIQILLDHGAKSDSNDFPYVYNYPLFVNLIAEGSENNEKVSQCAELLLQHGAYPHNPVIFLSELYEYRDVYHTTRINCLIAHLAMLDMLGITPCDEAALFTELPELREYYNKCRQVLKLAVVGTISLVDLLGYSEYAMRVQVRKQRFVDQVRQFFCSNPDLKTLYSYYSNTLIKRIDKIVRMVELENEAILIVSHMFHCNYNELYVFARRLVGYLSNRDLEQLCQV